MPVYAGIARHGPYRIDRSMAADRARPARSGRHTFWYVRPVRTSLRTDATEPPVVWLSLDMSRSGCDPGAVWERASFRACDASAGTLWSGSDAGSPGVPGRPPAAPARPWPPPTGRRSPGRPPATAGPGSGGGGSRRTSGRRRVQPAQGLGDDPPGGGRGLAVKAPVRKTRPPSPRPAPAAAPVSRPRARSPLLRPCLPDCSSQQPRAAQSPRCDEASSRFTYWRSESLITWAAITLMTRRLNRRKGRPARRPARHQPELPRAGRLTQALTPTAPHQRALERRRTAPHGVPHHASSHGWKRHRPSEMTSSLSSLTRMAVSSSMK